MVVHVSNIEFKKV